MNEPVQDPAVSTEREQDKLLDEQPAPLEADTVCVFVVGCHPYSKHEINILTRPSDLSATEQLVLKVKPGTQATAQILRGQDIVLCRGAEVDKMPAIVDPRGNIIV